MKNLYRRHRPLKLEDVVGQSETTDALAKSIKAGKISHAYLFVGPRGCGKTSVARIFAHAVNDFKYELEDDYVDIIEIDGASNRGIDNIRELREKAMIAPTQGKYKIYIIDEVHMLTKEAFNALLKTLEEPPEHVIFIMATTDAYKVPVTITSRAQTFTFKLADQNTMLEFLKSVADQEKIKISDEALKIIAKRGGGSFRDSLSLLDQISTLSDAEITREMVIAAMGLPEDEKIAELMTAYNDGNLARTTETLKELLASGVKSETLAEEIMMKILEEPKPELLPLLAKLPEVKDPFGEAKLLVALARADVAATPTMATPTTPAVKKPAVEAIVTAKKQAAVSTQAREAEAPAKKQAAKETTTQAQASETAAPAHFNWEDFTEKVRSLNDAISAQLNKCEHERLGNTLHIFPRTNIIRSILARENNKEILISNADGLKVEIHEAGEHPKSAEKDETIDKISGIMGGEVMEENGGSDPF